MLQPGPPDRQAQSADLGVAVLGLPRPVLTRMWRKGRECVVGEAEPPARPRPPVRPLLPALRLRFGVVFSPRLFPIPAEERAARDFQQLPHQGLGSDAERTALGHVRRKLGQSSSRPSRGRDGCTAGGR
jgi:hypothetical protein